MNGLGLMLSWGRRWRSLPAGVSIAMFGLIAPFGVAGAHGLHLPTPTPEPTALATTLSTSTVSGSSVTVSEGPSVRDNATLSGPNAANAHGKITYTLYSDSGCTEELGPRGGSAVQYGTIGPSRGVRLPAGTYYWQASYSGDARDQPSLSPCAAETVTPFVPWACSAVSGRARDIEEGGEVIAGFDLSTTISPDERFLMAWDAGQRLRLLRLKSASCVVLMHHAVFRGIGTAALDGVRGYVVRFTITVGDTGRMRVSALVIAGKGSAVRELDAASAQETTVLAGGTPVDLSALF